MRKLNRFIALLLAICTALSLFTFPAYATDPKQDIDGENGGGGVGGGSGTGTFATSQQGYRMYIIDNEGNLVSNIVDLRFSKTSLLNYGNTANYPWYEVYNTKFEEFPNTLRTIINGKASDNIENEVKVVYIEDLVGANFKSPMKSALIYNGSAFKGQGQELRDWLIEGTEMQSSLSSTGGGSGTNYRPVTPTGGGGTKPGDNTGGTTAPDTGNNDNDNASTGTSSLPNSTYTIATQIGTAMSNTFNVYRKSGIYTKPQAIAAALKVGNDRYNNLYKASIYSDDQLNYWKNYISRMVSALEHGYPDWEVTSKLDKRKPLMNTNTELDASNFINTSTVSMSNSNSFLGGIFDIAYANEENENRKGNIYNLLNAIVNGEHIFKFSNDIDLVKNSAGVDSIVETLIANDFRFCIEGIYWFAPARVGDINRWGYRFYGTVTNYAQVMRYNALKGYWTDGGSGGHMNPTLTKTAASALRTEMDLVAASGETLIYAMMKDLTSAQPHSELAIKTKTYNFQWYKGNKPKVDVPETSTYDDVPEDETYRAKNPIENKTPHKAIDPNPPPVGKIPLLSTELQVPGDPILPEDDPNYKEELEPGYLNTTRTIHIVKCYDIIHLDGTVEHVTTNVRDGEPGRIAIRHEPDYKVVGHFSSADYYGFTIEPITEEVEWEWLKVIEPTQISELEDTLKEWEYEEVADKKAGENVETVRIGVAADLEFDPDNPVDEKHPDGEPDPRYYDTTLYVHLVKKERIPETSTFDEPDYPPSGTPPVVPPHPAEDPYKPDVNDPETDPVEPNNRFAHYRIVKVYETEDEETGDITTDAVFVTFPTNPIVYIQDEAQKSTPDYSYHLIEWLYGDEYEERTLNIAFEPRWTVITAPVKAKEAGVTEAKVNLIDRNDFEKTVTLYVRLRRVIGEPRVPGNIIIEQSQISKVIHSNDKNIGGRFGDYEFSMTIGDFKEEHTSYYHDGCCGGCEPPCGSCHGHTCKFAMPGTDGDNEITFNFDLVSSQHDLEIPKKVDDKTDPKVYGNSGSDEKAIDPGLDYEKTISSLYAKDNKFDFTSNGYDSNGAEYIAVLWRCSKNGLNDVPTLASYKSMDIKNRYGEENYTLPEKMLKYAGTTADKISKKKRASVAMAFPYEFEFGIHSRSDLEATASCKNIGNYKGGCVDKDTQEYYTLGTTKFTYTFRAQVAIQFYAGRSKPLQSAQPSDFVNHNTHLALTTIHGTQQICYYPYIRMTYMVNKLADAIDEESNTYENGSINNDVRHDTYVLSEYESSVLPSDAVTVAWRNKYDKETLLLTSQQWSIHQRALKAADGATTGWQGRNQVLPGGAIYQLSTPDETTTRVYVTTYQTVVDDKARNEWLSKDLKGDEYTVANIAEEHKNLVNQVKEVMDNLKIVQWVCKEPSGQKDMDENAWTKEFTTGNGSVVLKGDVEVLAKTDLNVLESRSGLKEHPNTDDKYYVRKQGVLSSFADDPLSAYSWSRTVTNESSEKGNEGDLDVYNVGHTSLITKLFSNTSGDVYFAKVTITYKEGTNFDANGEVEADIKKAVDAMKDLNADTLETGTSTWLSKIPTSVNGVKTVESTVVLLFKKEVTGAMANASLTDPDAKDIDDKTCFITNFVSALTRNKGDDPTASWSNKATGGDGKWYNEAFDGVYMIRQATSFDVGYKIGTLRVAALDPALCPLNVGQADLYTKAFLSQFCVDSRSDATIAKDKEDHWVGTFKGLDIFMPDMELMYQSKKFYIPNANVQDLN